MARIMYLRRSSTSALHDLNGLIEELRGESKTAGSAADLAAVMRNKHATVAIAKDGNRIVGVGFLYVARKLGKRIGFIEDVVVSRDHRGQGLGKGIMRALISVGRHKKLTYLILTSRPARKAAHGLYKKLGFKKKETTVFRLPL